MKRFIIAVLISGGLLVSSQTSYGCSYGGGGPTGSAYPPTANLVVRDISNNNPITQYYCTSGPPQLTLDASQSLPGGAGNTIVSYNWNIGNWIACGMEPNVNGTSSNINKLSHIYSLLTDGETGRTEFTHTYAAGVIVTDTDGGSNYVGYNFTLLSYETFNFQLYRYYVKPGGNDNDLGTSWDHAFATIQKAINSIPDSTSSNGAPASGDYCGEVWVAAGTYTLDPLNPADSFQLHPGVALFGGFAGGETIREQRNWSDNQTILDGKNLHYHVVRGADYSTIDGFTITGGNANGGYDDNNGGGMYNVDVSPTVANCTFINNSAATGGGAIYFNTATPNPSGHLARCAFVTNCTFTLNNAACGGAVFSFQYSPLAPTYSYSVYFTGCIIGDWCPPTNYSVSGGNNAGYGGAIASYNYTYFDGCDFFCNIADSNGAAIWSHDVFPVRIYNSSFIGSWYDGSPIVNSPAFSGALDFGLDSSSSNYANPMTYITYCSIANNTTGDGVHLGDNCGAQVENCLIGYNSGYGLYGSYSSSQSYYPVLNNYIYDNGGINNNGAYNNISYFDFPYGSNNYYTDPWYAHFAFPDLDPIDMSGRIGAGRQYALPYYGYSSHGDPPGAD